MEGVGEGEKAKKERMKVKGWKEKKGMGREIEGQQGRESGKD